MRSFESEDPVAWVDVVIRLVHDANLGIDYASAVTPVGEARIFRRTLPDGSVREAALLNIAQDDRVPATVLRALCHRLGLSVDDVERLFGWTLPDNMD